MSTLFISHSSKDNEAALDLKARLEQMGHRSVFLDFDPDKGIQAGVSWERTLYTKLRACRAVVALCSDNYLSSHWCFAEVALARMEGKQIFVLKIDPFGKKTKLPSILSEDQYSDIRDDKESGYKELWKGFKLKGIVPEEHREWGPDEPPYPGLRSFDERDAPIFFGRDQEVREGVELLNRVRRHGHPRVVMVLGASGSGKSSLTRAGIIPQLRRDERQWLVVGPIRPGQNPLREASVALASAFKQSGAARSWEDIYRLLTDSGKESAEQSTEPSDTADKESAQAAKERLLQALKAMEDELTAGDDQVAESVHELRDLLRDGPGEKPVQRADPVTASGKSLAGITTSLRLDSGYTEASVVLIVDQFEELLGHEEAGPQHPANMFLDLLQDATGMEDHPTLVLGTMRSDYLGALQKTAPLQGVGFKSLSVGPISQGGMRELIEQPALLGQIELEDGLSERLQQDSSGGDALPLLAFTLRVMWDRFRDDRLLELREYEQLGGLQGAIAQVADETLEAALELGDEKELRNALLSLARPTEEGTGWARQPVNWDDLHDQVRPMVQHFVENRLLVKREDGTVEVAHESLFRSWAKLRGWLKANSEALFLLREIQLDAVKWDRAESGEEKEPYLWRGGRLARALELRESGVLSLKDLDHSFITRSHEAEQAEIEAEEARRQRELRQARVFAGVVGIICLVALGFFGWALIERGRAFEQKEIAVIERNKAIDQEKEATARKLSYASQNQLGVDNDLALLLGVEGARIKPLPEFDPLLRRALSTQGQVIKSLQHHQDIGLDDERVPFAAWDSDGARIVSTGYDHTAVVWDGVSGQRMTTCHVPGSGLEFAAWGPNGKYLVAGGLWDPRGAYLWAMDETGCGSPTRLRPFARHADWSRDGRRLVTSHREGPAWIWNVRGGDVEGSSLDNREEIGNVRYASWSPDGTRIVTANDDGKGWVYAADRTVLLSLEGHEGPIVSAAWNAEGTRIVTAGDDRTARVWNVANGNELAKLVGHSDKLTGAVWSREGNKVITTSRDQTARIWDAIAGTQQAVLLGHKGAVVSADLDLEGARIVTAGEDGTARVWDLSGKQRTLLAAGYAKPVKRAVWSPDSRFVLTAGFDGKVRVWNPEERGPLVVLEGHEGVVWKAAWSPDEKRIVTAGSKGGRARVWDAGSGEMVFELRASPDKDAVAHKGGAWSPQWSLDGRRILTAGRDGKARVWNAENGEMIFEVSGQDGEVSHAAWNKTGLIVTAHNNGPRSVAQIWSADGTEAVLRLQHYRNVVHAAWNASGTRIATSAWCGSCVQLWNVEDGEKLDLLGHNDGVWYLAWSPDEKRLATAGNDNSARIWNTTNGELLITLVHGSAVQRVAWNSDGSRIATVSDDKKVRIWNPDSETPIHVLEGHGAEPRYVAWSADDKFIVTAAKDSTARVWDAETGKELAVLAGHSAALRYAVWDKNGSRILTAGDDGSARVHMLGLENLIDAACRRVDRNMTQAEWQKYMGEEPRRATCPDL